MTAIPCGASPAAPPAPTNATTHDNQTARAATVDDAWHVLVDLDAPDDALRSACETLIAHCRDHRRDTARVILALLDGDA